MRVSVDKMRVKKKLLTRFNSVALAPLSEQILTDSNYFARQETGNLIASSQTASRPKDGKLIWRTPYAKKVYYTGNPSKNVNPHASLQWVEVARKTYGTDWQKLAQKKYDGK